MLATGKDLRSEAWAALGTVIDPELDEPITDLGFVRTLTVHGDDVEVHLRLPTAFCAPNFAYLMCSDAQQALRGLPGVGAVAVLLDDHHDSDKINTGLAAMAGYRGTFGSEAEDDLDQLRLTFRRKAYIAALERACRWALRQLAQQPEELFELVLGDLEEGPVKAGLLRRRADLGLPTDRGAPLLLDEFGQITPREEVAMRLRFARTVRVSVDGNAHFCRGLLRTRYPGSSADQEPRRETGEC
ncbi:metal-sulfur cluster biosynthetic enzyme [Propionibacteriaceae bacterium ES.041]|uniref:iron-sulfur cluster assembly protein n=1 Tax=Enemella evansiae TaxID=2016499 RepID=UPI000B96629D|nr:iron-sulfur cluster assembly protein [Enemella evansiae]OYN98596.1 metal-sulfur cluster biosynthetic enzyme [Enemella evansiae]PFG65708.1 metal-sulfur cluster biosynthetic enzyme [Propionibacteriaceae bacterium ES.041]